MANKSQNFIQHPLKFKGNYVEGQFQFPKMPNGEWSCLSPADLDDETAKVTYSYKDIERSVQAGRTARKAWQRFSLEERCGFLKKFQEAVQRHADEFAEIISREVGKPLWESKTEVAGMINKVDITINNGMVYCKDQEIENILPGAKGTTRFRPLGLLVVIGPFNFPAHLPNGHIVPALLTGNSVIFKPSEKTPMVGQLIAECFHEAGLPPGVFSLLQGEKELSRRLCTHAGIDGVLFTGSYEVGTRIKQDTLHQHWKLIALEMGGKNSALVLEDADMELALLETLTGAFITSGQRCSATSRIMVHESKVEEFTSRFHERAKAFKIGYPLDRDNQPFMGPVIDKSTVDRYQKFLGIASRQGCEVVMRGKILESDRETKKRGFYVTPSICLVKNASVESTLKSIYQQTELFAPNVAILPFTNLEDAIMQANATQYGLASSVFTQNSNDYQKCWEELESGIINLNKSTVGASSKLPFGGLKKSGNHWPTAITATRYCTYPVASIEYSGPVAKPDEIKAKAETAYPGINWE